MSKLMPDISHNAHEFYKRTWHITQLVHLKERFGSYGAWTVIQEAISRELPALMTLHESPARSQETVQAFFNKIRRPILDGLPTAFDDDRIEREFSETQQIAMNLRDPDVLKHSFALIWIREQRCFRFVCLKPRAEVALTPRGPLRFLHSTHTKQKAAMKAATAFVKGLGVGQSFVAVFDKDEPSCSLIPYKDAIRYEAQRTADGLHTHWVNRPS
jgi:hypothetical protein